MKVLTESEDVQIRMILNRLTGIEGTLDSWLEEIREWKEEVEGFLKKVENS
jgi:hypothetical protein